MGVISTILLAVQMLSALAMVGLILVQHGKGADMGAAFGSGGASAKKRRSAAENLSPRSPGCLLFSNSPTTPKWLELPRFSC